MYTTPHITWTDTRSFSNFQTEITFHSIVDILFIGDCSNWRWPQIKNFKLALDPDIYTAISARYLYFTARDKWKSDTFLRLKGRQELDFVGDSWHRNAMREIHKFNSWHCRSTRKTHSVTRDCHNWTWHDQYLDSFVIFCRAFEKI